MAVTSPIDVARIKKDFPILERQIHGRRLVYLDSASSSQKPRAVLDAMDHLYEHGYANTHRGVNEVIPVRSFNYRQFAVEAYHNDHQCTADQSDT